MYPASDLIMTSRVELSKGVDNQPIFAKLMDNHSPGIGKTLMICISLNATNRFTDS